MLIRNLTTDFIFYSLLLLALTATTIHSHEGHDQMRCGIDKACFALPPDCLTRAGQTCDMLFSIAIDESANYASMKLTSKQDPSSSPEATRWFAVGFSEDAMMGDDAVFECLHLDTGGTDFRLSYNSGKSNRVVGASPQSTDTKTEMRDGMISCSWIQALPFTVRGNRYDLVRNKYHLMLAKGSFRSASIKAYHNERIVSSHKIDLSTVSSSSSHNVGSSDSSSTSSSSSGSAPIYLIKAHGILMTCAWLVLASTGIMIARHYKSTFSGSTCCGVQLWFFLHRGLMLLLVSTVAAGAYCSWKFVGGWSGFSLHPVLGAATISGMVLQVLIAMCRCSPDHDVRFIFNWIHFTIGNVTHIAAIATIFTAYEATPLPILFLYLMGAFILFHIVIHLIMQMKRQPHIVEDSHDMAMNDSMQRFHVEVVGSKHQGDAFRKSFLVVYLIGIISIAAGLVLVILEKIG